MVLDHHTCGRPRYWTLSRATAACAARRSCYDHGEYRTYSVRRMTMDYAERIDHGDDNCPCGGSRPAARRGLPGGRAVRCIPHLPARAGLLPARLPRMVRVEHAPR